MVVRRFALLVLSWILKIFPTQNAEHAERFRYAMAKRPPVKRKER
jgi:hypothetical protein